MIVRSVDTQRRLIAVIDTEFVDNDELDNSDAGVDEPYGDERDDE